MKGLMQEFGLGRGGETSSDRGWGLRCVIETRFNLSIILFKYIRCNRICSGLTLRKLCLRKEGGEGNTTYSPEASGNEAVWCLVYFVSVSLCHFE